MKITEELLNEMKIKDENFSDGLIKPDGDYVRIPRGHLHGMMELLPWTENEIWKMIPDEKEEVSLSDKMIEIKDFARTHRKFSFRNLLESQCSKVQVIVTFLSILELMKMGHIHVEQDGLFDDISVEVQTDPDTWKNLTEFAEDEPQNTEINM